MDVDQSRIGFDEDWYLTTNPDVAAAVRAGTIGSGLQHYLMHGRTEGRIPHAAFNPTLYDNTYQCVHLFDVCEVDGSIKFIELAAASVRVPPPPRFFFGDVPHHISEYYFKMAHVQPMGLFVCRDMTVTAPYLITRDTRLFACTQANIHQAHLDEFLYESVATRLKTAKRLNGDCAMIFGPGHRIFGHWMIDFFPKIFLLRKAGYDISQISFLMPSDVPPFGIELLRSVGIEPDRIVQFDAVMEAVHCERLLLPTTCHNGLLFADLFREGIVWLRQRIESHVGSLAATPAAARIFVSRAHGAAGNRALVNRADIEALAVAEGFVLVYPEELSLFQQFTVFAGAQQIIGEYGSALHTAMFSPTGTVICALRGDSIHPGFAQSGIADALGHHTGYVFGTNVNDRWDFVIEPKHFTAALRCISSGVPAA